MNALSRPSRALDVGCSAGVFSVWLSKQGLNVTGVDLFPEATDMAQAYAEKNGVAVNLVAGDLFSYNPKEQFDLVFDSGCLHALVGGHVPRERVRPGLRLGGTYVLGHWGKRHPLNWRPLGPRQRSQKVIAGTFARSFAFVRAKLRILPYL